MGNKTSSRGVHGTATGGYMPLLSTTDTTISLEDNDSTASGTTHLLLAPADTGRSQYDYGAVSTSSPPVFIPTLNLEKEIRGFEELNLDLKKHVQYIHWRYGGQDYILERLLRWLDGSTKQFVGILKENVQKHRKCELSLTELEEDVLLIKRQKENLNKRLNFYLLEDYGKKGFQSLDEYKKPFERKPKENPRTYSKNTTGVTELFRVGERVVTVRELRYVSTRTDIPVKKIILKGWVGSVIGKGSAPHKVYVRFDDVKSVEAVGSQTATGRALGAKKVQISIDYLQKIKSHDSGSGDDEKTPHSTDTIEKGASYDIVPKGATMLRRRLCVHTYRPDAELCH